MPMPGKKHLPYATPKQNRMYEHVEASELKRGMPLSKAKTIGAATVNKFRARRGLTRGRKR